MHNLTDEQKQQFKELKKKCPKFEGTRKQIRYANDIRNHLLKDYVQKPLRFTELQFEDLTTLDNAGDFICFFKFKHKMSLNFSTYVVVGVWFLICVAFAFYIV